MLNKTERDYFESLSWEKADPIRERHFAELAKISPERGVSLAPYTNAIKKFKKELADARVQAFIETFRRINRYPDDIDFREFAKELVTILDNKGHNLPDHLRGPLSPFPLALVETVEEQLSNELRQIAGLALGPLHHFVNEGKLVAAQQSPPNQQTDVSMSIDIFISHSRQDVKIATALVRLLRNALNTERIRCTSVPGYTLEPGASVEETLRREVNESTAFIGLITPASLESTYVLFELGARWGVGRHLVPALASGADASILQDPLKGRNAVRCDVPSDMRDLIENLAAVLGLTPVRASAYEQDIKNLARLSKGRKKRASKKKEEAGVEPKSGALASNEPLELSPEERDLLIAAAKTGEIFLHTSNEGKWLTAGNRKFPEDEDPASVAKYIAALKSLCGRGYAEYDEGDLYGLTSIGFEVARGLKQLGTTADIITPADTKANQEALSSSVSFEKLEITSDLHRYSLVFTLCLNSPPAKNGYSLKFGWPNFIRITRQRGMAETGSYVLGKIEYREFTLESQATLWPGQSIDIAGRKGRVQLEYVFDHLTWEAVDGKNITLNWAVFFTDTMPVEGKVDFDDLNVF